MFRLFTKAIIRLNRFKNVRSQGVICDIRLLLLLYVFVMAQPDDAFSKKAKHVASHCKQKGICLTVKLCRLTEKVMFDSYCKTLRDATHKHCKSRSLLLHQRIQWWAILD